MAAILKPGTVVRDLKIIELAGDGSQSNVYLAEHEGILYWLIQIEDSHWEPNVRFGSVERFEANGSAWVTVAVNATTMVNLAGWVDRLELAFIGWRWAKLARTIGFMHDKGAVVQNTQPLALDRLVFNIQAELTVALAEPGEIDAYAFPPPESAAAISPASDVYSLGASLKALVGDSVPRGVQSVLQRATNPDASKRYPNGAAFGEALAAVLPNPNREKAVLARPKRTLAQWLMLGALLSCGGLALCLALLAAVFFLQPSLMLPTAVTLKPNPLRVTILNWNVEGGCNARVDVQVQDSGQFVSASDGVLFSATTPQRTLNALNAVPGAQPGESVLTFPMGAFCEAGGALEIGAQHEAREGKSIVYYYPPDEDVPANPILYKPGGVQALLHSGGAGRLYFGLVRFDGGAADLRGAIKIKLLQDGQEVEDFRLRAVNSETDPLVAVLVMDTSTSMLGDDALIKARQAAVNFIEKLHPKDYVCLYSFATTVNTAFVCATNHKSALEAVNKLTALGNTALYDVLVTVGKQHANKAERQAIVLLSDGADNSSQASHDQALNDIINTNVPVYAIGLQNRDLAPDVLKEIAERTGGEYLEAPTPNDLTALYENLQARFANQYQIDFTSIYPDRTSGTLELIIDDGAGPMSIKKYFQVQP